VGKTAVDGAFPHHFDQLFLNNPELEWFDAGLVQGRWNEQLAKKINDFHNLQLFESSGWDKPGQEDISLEPGLTLKFNKMNSSDQQAEFISFIDSILSVALLEKFHEIKDIMDPRSDEKFSYFSYPYEQFCKESTQFTRRLLY